MLAPQGTLHVASNVEDVAVHLLASALSTEHFDPVLDGMEDDVHDDAHDNVERGGFAAPTGSTADRIVDVPRSMPRRQRLWREGGGEQAKGRVWQFGARTLLAARSETELAYQLEARPTYRFVLQRRP